MKGNALLQHILLAIGLSTLALVNDLLLRQFFNVQLCNQLNISLLLCLYLGFIIRHSPFIAGRITLCAINLSIVLLGLLTINHTGSLLMIYLAMIFCSRVLLCYAKLFAIMAEFVLCIFSATAAFWLLALHITNT